MPLFDLNTSVSLERYESPIFYMGNKFKLLSHILPLFPIQCNVFVDLFGGSGSVSMNYQGKVKTIYNEYNPNIVGLIKMILENEPQELDDYWQQQIVKYNLDQGSNKVREAYAQKKTNFEKLRYDYNSLNNKDFRDLFLLSCYSINHLMRFNTDSEFNAPSGNDGYNYRNYKKVYDMHKRFKDVEIILGDAFDFDFSVLNENDFVYCDPPYTNSMAVYNEQRAFGNWTVESDFKLFNVLENLDSRNIKWGLSNVFINRSKINKHLIEWCNKNNWSVTHLYRNYNPFSRGNSNNDEVYITNYVRGG